MPTAISQCPCCATPAESPQASPAYTQCSQCAHRWRTPQEAVSGRYYEALVERNDPYSPWFKRKIAERVAAVSCLLTAQTRRVLEIGCAEGVLGEEIKHGYSVVYDGVELSQDRELALTRLDQVFSTPAEQVKSVPYDLIVSFHVLEHIANPAQEIQAWSTLLAPSGQLLIEVPNGAGHPLLVNDLNPEHLHQFTPVSLTMLLARQGFTCHHLSLGHYESPVYPDSIRVVAQPPPRASQQRSELLQRFRERTGGPFIAYGVGGDFTNYVKPLADALDIQALLDSSPAKWGQRLGQDVVTGYSADLHGELPVLICSIKFSAVIRQHLLALGIAPERIIDLEAIYAGS